MVYMTVDNLGPYAEQNLIQMQNAAAHLPGNVKIAVLLDQNLSEGDFATGADKAWQGAARGDHPTQHRQHGRRNHVQHEPGHGGYRYPADAPELHCVGGDERPRAALRADHVGPRRRPARFE